MVYNLTYNTMATHEDVDTTTLRRALFNYVHCMYGIRYGRKPVAKEYIQNSVSTKWKLNCVKSIIFDAGCRGGGSTSVWKLRGFSAVSVKLLLPANYDYESYK